ncbi:MAG: translational machinery protein [Burkholderiales bacterium]|nr:translational machinery protein [Burkholderiales bacterium]
MKFGHVVVWLDQAEAHIIHFNREEASAELVKSSFHHLKAGVGAQHGSSEQAAYLEEVVKTLADADEILIVGPGLEKLTLVKYLLKHHHGVSEKVVGVETVDHPSDGQLLAYARKYFVRADMFV